ncbi:MAG: 2-succinyl-6-hydroxy-2,4-cyclohexadiene-1-carboxylate synthase [Acidimicrobiales bacterium]
MAGSRRLALADGVELRVELHGGGAPVVLLHGFTGDASTMDVLASRLAIDRRVIVPDLIGHGGSTGPRGAHGVDEMAGQIVEMMAALGEPAPFDLLGYSMGGRVALTLACRHPGQVASLTLIGASAGLATEDERATRREADEKLAATLQQDGLDSFVDAWMANPLFATQTRLGTDFLAGARAQRLRNSSAGLARSLRAAGTGTMRPLHDLLARCHVPTALVVGADDEKFRVIAADLGTRLPAATVAVIDDAGHAAHLEQPDTVVEAVREVVARATVQVIPLSLPMRGAHATGRGTVTRRDSMLVRLRADSLTGWGEASPLTGWSPDETTTVGQHRPGVLDLDDTPTAWNATTRWRDALEDAPAARAAVVGAALDLDARRAGRPLHRHLAAWHPRLDETAVIDRLAVNALVSDPDPADVAASVRRHVDAGFRTIKLKVGALDPQVDRARVAAARRAGGEVALRLDANGAWDHDTAVGFLRDASTHGIELCEEPVRGIEEIVAVGEQSPVPVAVDESVRDLGDLDALISRAAAIAALVVKPQALGGADRAIDMIVAARAAGLDVIVTSMIDSAVGLAHAAHVAAACGLGAAHGLGTASMLGADVATGLPVDGGHLALGDQPGLGIGLVSPVMVDPS